MSCSKFRWSLLRDSYWKSLQPHHITHSNVLSHFLSSRLINRTNKNRFQWCSQRSWPLCIIFRNAFCISYIKNRVNTAANSVIISSCKKSFWCSETKHRTYKEAYTLYPSSVIKSKDFKRRILVSCSFSQFVNVIKELSQEEGLPAPTFT